MKIYLPLSTEGDLYVAGPSAVELSAWEDVDFLSFFEKNLEVDYTPSLGRVSIAGTEYPDCEVYFPNEAGADWPYVAVDNEFVPQSVSNRRKEVTPSEADAEWIKTSLTDVNYSDAYFHDLTVDLSTRYVLPNVSVGSGDHVQLADVNLIRKSPRILVIGPPGAGKTSFARHLAYTYNKRLRSSKRPRTPTAFYIQLRNFSNRTRFIAEALQRTETGAGSQHVAYQQRGGRVVYIFDGLDELNESDRTDFSDWLASFHTSRPAVSTIVTSRELNSLHEGFWSSFLKTKIEPFNRTQIDEYCQLLLGNQGKSKRFLGIIYDNPELSSFVTNPFSLSLAIGLYVIRGTLPYNIGTLCKEFVLHLTEKWDLKRGIRRSSLITSDATMAILGRLSYKLYKERIVQFDSWTLGGLLPIELEGADFDAILTEIQEATGLVTQTAPGVWGFSHRYLQDFFCANYLMERVGGLSDELRKHSRDRMWSNVWRQVSQLCSDPEFFARLDVRNESDPIYTIDRIVSGLLVHDGVSKAELDLLVDGLVDELKLNIDFLPSVSYEDGAFSIDLSRISREEGVTLASVLLHIYYLAPTRVGTALRKSLETCQEVGLAKLFDAILRKDTKPQARLGVDTLKVGFDSL